MSSVDDLIEEALRARREDRAADARCFAEQALSEARGGGDAIALIHALKLNGQIERDDGRLEAALAFYLQAIDLGRDQSDPLLLAHTIRHTGDIHWAMGDVDLAEPCFEEAIEIYRAASPSAAEFANALRPMAILKQAAEDKAAAYDLWEEAGALYAKAGIEAGVEEAKRRVAELAATQ